MFRGHANVSRMYRDCVCRAARVVTFAWWYGRQD